ncbi:ATP-dependent DNA helicase chl1 [Dispira simplex]|nr:ATP-dependent DNA helicase chl1 [Dispira simplex]
MDSRLPTDTSQPLKVVLPVPDQISAFRFPYQPYEIQEQFMKNLYETLERGRIGIFESPTGTGKTLSLVCGAFKWLEDHACRLDITKTELRKQLAESNDTREPDWVLFQDIEVQIRDQQVRREAIRERQRLRRVRVEEWETRRRTKRTRNTNVSTNPVIGDNVASGADDEFLLDPYEGDLDSEQQGSIGEDGYSATVRTLLQSLESDTSIKTSSANHGLSDNPATLDAETEPYFTTVYFASRTHSQLSQLIHEVRKTAYSEHIAVTPMGSRNTLCIHDPVKSLGNIQRINETCLDMQKSGVAANKRCPYFPKDSATLHNFQDHALAEVHDIEDMVQLGRQLHVCPYYGNRSTLSESQLVTLPYNLLLQKSARESLGIRLRGNIVIIDEAHNLADTLSQIHSCTVHLDHVNKAFSQLTAYFQKYKNRLSGGNVIYVRQLLSLLKALRKYLNSGGNRRISLTPATNDTKEPSCMLTTNDLLHELKIDNINLFQLQRFMQQSEIAKKLNGFIDREQQRRSCQSTQSKPTTSNQSNGNPNTKEKEKEKEDGEDNDWTSLRTTLPLVETFLMALTNTDRDGRIILGLTTPTANTLAQPFLKYVLLNPCEPFREVVEEARSVVVAGGTMEPVDEFLRLLFHYVPQERIHRFSCGHIIPPTSLLTLSVTKGPGNRTFNFVAGNRTGPGLLTELGQAVFNLCNVIPRGVVCFLPSYTYLDQVYDHWQKSGMLAKLEMKKQVFREPRSSSEVDQILADYSRMAQQDQVDRQDTTQRGALLLSVVGGKMSEGINFSDDLGRGIIMVGLPFANLGSAELREKIRFMGQLESSMPAQISDVTTSGSTALPNMLTIPAGRLYYENLCMKAVNQSIGRAIRHRDDYAVVVLLDERYGTPRIYTKLPGWIAEHRLHCDSFGTTIGRVAQFFRGKAREQRD